MSPSAAILATLGVLAAIPIAIAWRGYVLAILWGWFMVPAFGLPALTVVQAIGVSLTVAFITYQYQPKAMEPEEETWKKVSRPITHLVLGPAMSLLMGWIVKSFA